MGEKNFYSNRVFGENGAIKVVCNFALTVFDPLPTEGLNYKNYLLWSLLERIFKKIL